MATYPAAIKSWTSVVDNVNDVMAADVNSGYAEMTAIETELGADVAGTAADLVTRLARSLSGTGNLDFATAGALTISGGSITPVQNYHTIDTESSAATDNLDTIVATNATDGFILILRQNNAARDVTVTTAGNIVLPGTVSIVMTAATSFVVLIYDATNTKWLCLPGADNVAVTNAANTFSASNIFGASIDHKYTAVSGATTASAVHFMINADCTAAGRTITLPTAVGCAGRTYVIRKLDVSGNAVTIACNGAEHVNGVDTQTLAAQYDTATVMSDGAGWMVI